MTFAEILDRYRQESSSKTEYGTKFEELIARYFMTDPLYAGDLESVVLWRDFPFRNEFGGGGDIGIDLVARTTSGEYWAVQCKMYAEDNTVSKKDIDSFLSASGKGFIDENQIPQTFSGRYIVSTTDDLGRNAAATIEGQTLPVSVITLNALSSAEVNWDEIEKGAHGADARRGRLHLRNHQREALKKGVAHFRDYDRGKLIMACGTGKTFTSLKLVETLLGGGGGRKNPLVLFLAPSISLVGQNLRGWAYNSENDFTKICVCSDPKASRNHQPDELGEKVEYLGYPATTDVDRILEQYGRSEGATVIFSTYQSIDVIISAQKRGLPDFDFIVCDEAHRTTGAVRNGEDPSCYLKVHDGDALRGRRRLYMTATPRIYGVKGKDDAKKASAVLFSMDDEEQYGKEFYHLSFGRAVEMGLLSDYKVLILTIDEEDVPEVVRRGWNEGSGKIDANDDCRIWGCLNGMAKNIAYDITLRTVDPLAMRSAVVFSHTIARSKALTERFNELAATPGSPIKLEVRHIDGGMDASKRDRLLNWLRKGEEGGKVLSNVRCLSEGVDVPALDCVIFMDAKNSLIDIVQSVGRVMRRADDKKYGYIIIPIVVPENDDPETALDRDEEYRTVWTVLRALRSHDERLDAEINTIQYRKDNTGKHIHLARIRRNPAGEMRREYARLDAGQYTLDDFGLVLFARLLLKVGDREYIENWARNIAKVMPDIMERLGSICKGEVHGYKQAFQSYLAGLRSCVNDEVSAQDAVNMLAQQIVTKPIFERLFGSDDVAIRNSVSETIDAMLQRIDDKGGLKDVQERLGEFYASVERTLSQIDNNEGRQRVITSMYEKFFKNAFPKDQSINGMVYTPQEIVDFILNSAAEALKEEFGVDINDEGVNILDPFTGTGTFIARLMETGIIYKEDLERKYRNELFANEITLLAYYIATVNIENTFARMTGSEEYVPFENILLTDTFNIKEICERKEQATLDGDQPFRRNKARIRRENETPITVIVGNPPYGANQKSANDDAKKRKYRRGVDQDIERTYLDGSLFYEGKGNVNSVYDNYVRAFRWATDRLRGEDGIIAFVTPNGWLAGSAFEGFRKTIESEFSKIYVFNLRGDATTQGETRRKEGDGVFRDGSRTAIAVTLLVRKNTSSGKAVIHYCAVNDYLKYQEKLDLLRDSASFLEMERRGELTALHPRENGDWIVERNEAFNRLVPMAGDTHKKYEKHNEKTLFVTYVNGQKTNRDSWSYNYSKEAEKENSEKMVSEYNRQLSNGVREFDSSKLSWDSTLFNDFQKGKTAKYVDSDVILASYRPFCKRWFFSNKQFINSPISNRIYPDNGKNLTICVSGIGVKKGFSCLMTDKPTDVQMMANGQCFPLYWYEDAAGARRRTKQSGGWYGEFDDLVRHDGVSDCIAEAVAAKYGKAFSKEDIFYYVYGYLHSEDYRAAFAEDLRLSLPRIGLVDDAGDFLAFSAAGRELAELHLNYEDAEPPRELVFGCEVSLEEALKDDSICRVEKMRVLQEDRRIVYNRHITIDNVPEEAFRYVVNGRSAIAWVAESYRVSTDRDSGITSDPNEYSGGRYVLKLLLSVIGVSVRTVRITGSLPRLDFSQRGAERSPRAELPGCPGIASAECVPGVPRP